MPRAPPGPKLRRRCDEACGASGRPMNALLTPRRDPDGARADPRVLRAMDAAQLDAVMAIEVAAYPFP